MLRKLKYKQLDINVNINIKYKNAKIYFSVMKVSSKSLNRVHQRNQHTALPNKKFGFYGFGISHIAKAYAMFYVLLACRSDREESESLEDD